MMLFLFVLGFYVIYYQVNLIVKHPFDGFERVFYNYFNILNLRL